MKIVGTLLGRIWKRVGALQDTLPAGKGGNQGPEGVKRGQVQQGGSAHQGEQGQQRQSVHPGKKVQQGERPQQGGHGQQEGQLAREKAQV